MLRRPSPSALRLVAAMALGLALLAGLTVLSARLWVEWQWFEQFDKGQVLLHRWLLQLAAAAFGLGVGLALQRWLTQFWRPRPAASQERRFALAPLPYAACLGGLALVQLVPLALLLLLAERLVVAPFDPRGLHGLTVLSSVSAPLVLLLAGLTVALLARPQ